MPDSPKPDETPKPPEAPPVPDPEKEQLTRAAEDSARRAAIAEQRAAYAAGVAAASRPQAPREQAPDILDRFVREDLTLPPEDKKAMLDQAMRVRAAEVQRVSEARMEQRMAAERANMESKFALDLVTAQRPELADPKNVPNFGAAITKAQMEAQAAGLTLSSAQLAQRAGVIYDQLFRPKDAPRTPLPFTEQPNPGFQGLTPEQMEQFKRQPQSQLEKTYGRKPGTIQPPYDINDKDSMEKLNLDYVRSRNEPLFKRGAVSSLDAILNTRPEQT